MTPDERRIQELEEELRALKLRQRADEGAASVKKKVSSSVDNCDGDGYDGPIIGIPEGQASGLVGEKVMGAKLVVVVFFHSLIIIFKFTLSDILQ